jgi:DNA-binding NtrC family response regulator
MRILIVDDDRSARRLLVRVVEQLSDVELHEASGLEESRLVLAQHPIEVALIDLRLGSDSENRDGLQLVQEARQRGVVPLVVSGFADLLEVRAAMRVGAFDYLLKEDISAESVLPVLEELRRCRRLEKEVIELRARKNEHGPCGLVGSSTAIQRLRESIKRVALSDRPVLVTGPTGSGKELTVRAIHQLGANPEAPLLDLNCGALPATLIESQLFGHERGSFTGADRRHSGFFSVVENGTLFLDEIGEMPLDLQAKLLRVLETGTFRPLGSNANKRFAGRVVAATHVDLEARVQERRFREDLFYRLNVLEIQVPSLDDRCDDIPALVAHFVSLQGRRLSFTAEAMEKLTNARWPGNIRQLRNLVDRLAVYAPDGPVTPEVLDAVVGPSRTRGADAAAVELAREVLRSDAPDKLKRVESILIEEALTLADGVKSKAARLLGVHRKVIERRLETGALSTRESEVSAGWSDSSE